MSIPAAFIADGIMPHKLRTLVHSKPDINIALHSRNKTYTTLDRIEGVVSVTAPVDTPFDAFEIEFVGSSRAFVQRMSTTAAAAASRSEAFHQFLKLTQPGLARLYPEDNILCAGRTYEFPFVFAVPRQLLPRICQHQVTSPTVHDAHLHLPPTFGDHALGGKGTVLDDMAPEMASIRYGVFAKIVTIKSKGDETWRSTMAAKARRVRVVPATEEQPPLSVHAEDGEYNLRKEKTIRKTLFSGKAGTLAMEASQPRAFQLQSYSNPDSRTDTVAKVLLRFDPHDEKNQPPKLGSLASKLKVTTYFGCTARRNFPSKLGCYADLSQGLHTEQLSLSSRSMAGVEWSKRDPSASSEPGSPSSPTPRRASFASAFSHDAAFDTPEPSAGYKGGSYYIAHLVVPVTLPTNKNFPPTFHSCLISRVYALKLDLSLQSAGIAPSLEIKVPVQISSEGLVGDEFARNGSVDYSVEADIDGDDGTSFFESRAPGSTGSSNMFAPPPRARMGSQAPTDDAPPGYSPLASMGNTRGASRSGLPTARAFSVPVY